MITRAGKTLGILEAEVRILVILVFRSFRLLGFLNLQVLMSGVSTSIKLNPSLCFCHPCVLLSAECKKCEKQIKDVSLLLDLKTKNLKTLNVDPFKT